MKWIQALLLMAIGLSGCKNQPSLTDPFGQTRIPPPSTGSLYGRPANGVAPPVVVGPTGTAGGAALSTTPAYGNAPLSTAPAWPPPATTGTPPPGMISPPSQPSTTNYTNSTIPGAITSPPAVQPGTPAPPAGTLIAPPSSPNPAPAPTTNILSPPAAVGPGVTGGYRLPANPRRNERPFFNGGVPDRRTLPVTTTSPQSNVNVSDPGLFEWCLPQPQEWTAIPPNCSPSNCIPVVSSCNSPQAIRASAGPLQPVPDPVSGSPVALTSYTAPPDPKPAGTPKPKPSHGRASGSTSANANNALAEPVASGNGTPAEPVVVGGNKAPAEPVAPVMGK
jgi:hypothetical protein